MCAEALARKLSRRARRARLPKIVVPVHLCRPELRHGRRSTRWRASTAFSVIEDASHAIGGSYQGRPVGDGRYSDITVFSFHPVKIITTAEGGMAMTNDPTLAQRMELLRSHGITRDPALMTREPDGPWYYQQVELGYNYRMTDLQAALGLSQLARLGRHTSSADTRWRGATTNGLPDLPLVTPWQHPATGIRPGTCMSCGSTQRGRRARVRRAAGRTHRRERPLHPGAHAAVLSSTRGVRPSDFPQAERYYAEAISLPMYATLDEGAQDHVIAALGRALQR